jgi:hypothetical protein
VLRPSKPVPEGKKAKCPKCSTLFTVKAETPPPRQPATRPKPSAVKKKPEPVLEASEVVEDIQDPGTYAFVEDPDLDRRDEDQDRRRKPRDEDDEDDEDDDRETGRRGKPKIDYGYDTSIKDPRGPAQEMVVRPSNYMMITGAVGTLGYLVSIVVILWPLIFPEVQDEKKKKEQELQQTQQKAKLDKPDDTFLLFKELSLMDPAKKEDWGLVTAICLGIVAGGVYSSFIAFGAVRMQNLEGRNWALASSIMSMVPIGAGGFWLVTGTLAGIVLSTLVFDDKESVWMAVYVVAGMEVLWGVLIGLWNLRTLLDEKVKTGYEYVAD